MDRLCEDFESVRHETTFLGQMVPGSKPYTAMDGGIAVASPGIFQGVMRYLRGESVTYSIHYATGAVDQLTSFLERFMEYVRWNPVTEEVKVLYRDVSAHLGSCIEGLNTLSATYVDNETFETLKRRLMSSISLFEAGLHRYSPKITANA